MQYTAWVQIWDEGGPYTRELGQYKDSAEAANVVETAARRGLWDGPTYTPPHHIMGGCIVKPGEEVPLNRLWVQERGAR